MGNATLKRAEKRSKQLAREIQRTEKKADQLSTKSKKFKDKRSKKLKDYSKSLSKNIAYSLKETTQMLLDAERKLSDEYCQNYMVPLGKLHKYLDEIKHDKEICDYYIEHHKEKDE